MKPAALFRFYDMRTSQFGEPFPLCEKCRKVQKIPDNCILNKIADKADQECCRCLDVKEEKEKMKVIKECPHVWVKPDPDVKFSLTLNHINAKTSKAVQKWLKVVQNRLKAELKSGKVEVCMLCFKGRHTPKGKSK